MFPQHPALLGAGELLAVWHPVAGVTNYYFLSGLMTQINHPTVLWFRSLQWVSLG